jgi:hypothetical protein
VQSSTAQQTTYNYYSPSLETKQILAYDANIKNQSGEISIYNRGGRVINFNPSLYNIAVVTYSNYQKKSYIRIYGYCDSQGEETYQGEGLLWEYKIGNGYDKFDKLSKDFNSAASEAYSDASLSLNLILNVSYKNFAMKPYYEFYNVLTSEPINYQDANKIIDEAMQAYNLAQKFDISLSLDNCDGEKLFQWWQANLKK